MFKKTLKLFLISVITILSLQYSLSFYNDALKDDSYLVVIEFKEVHQGSTLGTASKMRADKRDIDHTFINKQDYHWTVNVVFKKGVTQQLIKMHSQNLGKQLAVILNSDFITIPPIISKINLTANLNAQRQYQLRIPTNFPTFKEADQFLAKYNM